MRDSSATSRLLPMPGHADERDELRLALASHARQGAGTTATSSSRPTDQRRRRCSTSIPKRALACERPPGGDGLRLALRRDGLELLVRDRVRRRAIRRLSDEHAVDGCRRLEAGRRVDDVAGDHCLARRPRVHRSDERLTCVDRDAHLAHPSRRARVADRERRPNRPFGVVLVRDAAPRRRPSPRRR